MLKMEFSDKQIDYQIKMMDLNKAFTANIHEVIGYEVKFMNQVTEGEVRLADEAYYCTF